jgi:hypothetical protein
MPDPVLFIKAMAASAAVSAAVALALIAWSKPAGAARVNTAAILAITLGLLVGYRVLGLLPGWPPTVALDRFFIVVLPSALGIELVAGFQHIPKWAAWLLRITLAGATPQILLHGSTYLTDPAGETNIGQSFAYMGLGGGLLAVVWGLMAWLSRRSPGISLPLVISETALLSGVGVMLSGYTSGGEAALPLAASLAAVAGVLWLFSKPEACVGTVGIGVVGLFGVLVLGRFFGELSTGRALAVFVAPLLCWLTELPWLRKRKPWKIGVMRIALAAIPLLIVVALAKRDFDRNMEANSGYAATPAPSWGR